MKILITGFNPFGGETINPAWEAVKLMKDEYEGAELIKLQIPTEFKKSVAIVHEKMQEIKPDVVINVGQAGGRNNMTVERVAINVMDGTIGDNVGFMPQGEPNFEDGDVGYFATLPIKAMVKKMQDAGYPATVSDTAGTYVCNHVMYGVLYYINREFPNTKGGFIHVPFIPEQVVNKPRYSSMALRDIAKCLELCVEAVIENDKDIAAGAGSTH